MFLNQLKTNKTIVQKIRYSTISRNVNKKCFSNLLINEKYNIASTSTFNDHKMVNSTHVRRYHDTAKLLQTISNIDTPATSVEETEEDIPPNTLDDELHHDTQAPLSKVLQGSKVKKELDKSIALANEAKEEYTKETTDENKKTWIEKEETVIKKYQETIEHVRREDKHSTTRSTAQNHSRLQQIEDLLVDMMERYNVPICTIYEIFSDDESTTKKVNPSLAEATKLINTIVQAKPQKQKEIPILLKLSPNSIERIKKIHVLILNTISRSKLYKKGLHGDLIFLQFIKFLGFYYKYQLVLQDDACMNCLELLDSHLVSLIIKCHAHSTYKNSLVHITEAHNIHSLLYENKETFPYIIKDYPLLYTYSLKSLNSYASKAQREYSKKWFDSLCHYATSPSEGSDIVKYNNSIILDIKPRVTSILNEYLKLKSPSKIYSVLKKSKDIVKYNKTNTNKVDLKIDANMYKKLFKAIILSDDNAYVEKYSFRFMDELVSNWKQYKNDTTSDKNEPLLLPTDQCISAYIQTLAMTQGNNDDKPIRSKKYYIALEKRVKDIIQIYREMLQASIAEPSIDVCKSYLQFYVQCYSFYNTNSIEKLLPILKDVVEEMKDVYDIDELGTNGNINAILLKGCSVVAKTTSTKSNQDDAVNEIRKEAWDYTHSIYNKLLQEEQKRKEKDDGMSNSVFALTDDCYAYLMKSIYYLYDPINPEAKITKEQRVKQLFKEAANKGLVNANVVFTLKQSLEDEKEFEKIVGDGRLPDLWVRNVTTGKAYYTDGSKGGPGKFKKRKKKKGSDQK